MLFTKLRSGFTLLELMTVVAIMAILAGVVLAAINPGRQFATSRNTARLTDLQSIMSAVSTNIAANSGTFTCAAGTLPSTATTMASSGGYNIGPCLVPAYLPSLSFDPSTSGAHWTSTTDYDTGYTISQDTNGYITLNAPGAELSSTISITR